MSTLNSLIAKIMVIGIILAFIINFGPQAGTACAPNQGPAIIVDGEEISAREFHRVYSQQLRRRSSRTKGEFTVEQAQAEGFAKQVADVLVETYLLAAEAERRGMEVGDQELRQELKRIFDGVMPAGGWDQREYEMRVQGMEMSVPEFETSTRHQLSAQKVLEALMWAAEPSQAELKDSFRLNKNQGRFQSVMVKLKSFNDQVEVPGADAIAAWAKANGEIIKSSYEAHEARWTQSEKVKARHILAKVAKTASPEEKKAARGKIEAAIKELEGGADFAELAKKVSEGPSGPKGGDLGEFGRGAMVKAFEEAAFALKPGEISAVVESSFGFHVIKVETKTEAGKTSLEDASEELAKELMIKEETSQLARAEADRIQALIKGEDAEGLDKVFTGAASETNPLGLKSEDSNWIRIDSRSIPGVGTNPGLAKQLLAQTEKGPCPQVYSAEGGFVVCELTDRKQADEEDFDNEAENLRLGLRYSRQSRLRKALVEQLRSEADIQINWSIVRVPGTNG